MSNADGKQPDPNELNLPGDEEQLEGFEELDLPGGDASDPLGDLGDLGDLELPDAGAPLEEAGLPEEDGPRPLAGVGESADEVKSLGEESGNEAAESEEETSEEDEGEPSPPREGMGIAGFAVFGVCGLSILLLIALDVMVFLGWGLLFMLFMNVFWLMATAIPFIMWMGRKTLNFYEIVLGISLAAIIIAVALLLVELVDYEGEITPKGGTAATVHLSSDTTITVA